MDNINPCTTGNGENGWYVMCLKYRLNVIVVSNQKVGVYSRKTPKTGLFTFPAAVISIQDWPSGVAIKWIRYTF